MNKKRLKLVSLLALLIMVVSLPVSANGQTKQIKDLPTGSIVYDPSWTWEHRTGDGYTGSGVRKSVDWLIVAKNHTGYPSNSVTLLSNELIGKYAFDDSTNRGSQYGYNHWGDSGEPNATAGIRLFLNTSFFNTFSQDFKNLVLETTLNMKTYTGSNYTSKDKVFLPSENELGGSYAISDGSSWGYFSSNSSRIAKVGSDNDYYWTRSPHSARSHTVRCVSSDGSLDDYLNSASPRYGVRPVANIKSDTMVKQVGSKWEIVYTKPDTTGPNITLTPSTTSKTNKDVVITVSTIDPNIAGAVTSGVKKIQKPDGSWVNGSTTTYVANANGTYEFKAEDNAGNIASKSITISNINKDKPVITIEPYNKEWTNKDIVVKAKVDKGTLNEVSHTFTENGVFNFIATDDYGNRSEKAVVIDNIDKIPPKMKINVR